MLWVLARPCVQSVCASARKRETDRDSWASARTLALARARVHARDLDMLLHVRLLGGLSRAALLLYAQKHTHTQHFLSFTEVSSECS